MADVAALRSDGAPAALETLVSGKLIEQRRHEGEFFSVVLAAAKDQFSPPVPLEVRSDHSLGSQGEIINVRCAIGGYRARQFQQTDRNTGEVRRVSPVRMTLRALN